MKAWKGLKQGTSEFLPDGGAVFGSPFLCLCELIKGRKSWIINCFWQGFGKETIVSNWLLISRREKGGPERKEADTEHYPHVCRYTYCSNQARVGMNPKTLQYLMGHSEIGVTMNVYTHLGLEDAAEEMARMEQVEAARKEQEKISGEAGHGTVTQKMFRVV